MSIDHATLSGIIQGNSALSIEEYQWGDILGCMYAIISAPFSVDTERLLLLVLRSNKRLPLDPSSELPHSMSPENMLKSLAVQALVKWTGVTYLRDIEQVAALTSSPVLAGIARAMIREATQTNAQFMADEDQVDDIKV